MGGVFLGHTDLAAMPGEFNFWCDPDAAAVGARQRRAAAARRARRDPTGAARPRGRGRRLAYSGRRSRRFAADCTDEWIDHQERTNPGDDWDQGSCALHDPLAVAVVARPDLVTWRPARVARRDAASGCTRGVMVADLLSGPTRRPQLRDRHRRRRRAFRSLLPRAHRRPSVTRRTRGGRLAQPGLRLHGRTTCRGRERPESGDELVALLRWQGWEPSRRGRARRWGRRGDGRCGRRRPRGIVLLDGLRHAGVDVADIAVRREAHSGAALIFVADGARTRSSWRPAPTGRCRRTRSGRRCDGAPAAVVLAQGELPVDTVAATLEEAAAVGARPVLNLAPVIALDRNRPDALRSPRGQPARGESPARARPRRCRRPGGRGDRAVALARSAVVTGGDRGAWVGQAGQARHVAARPATAVDSTGAGDAFTGAMVVALSLGRELTEAAAWGAAAAAYAVERPGAQASFPRGAEVGLGQSGGIP